MSTTTINRETVLEQLKGLPEADGRWVVESFIWGSSKAKASRKRDPDAPKKEVKPDSYFHLNNGVVWPLLKAYIEANGEELGEERTKALKGVKARTQISSAIWATIKDLDSEARLAAIEAVNEEAVLKALESWTEAPPETRYKGAGGASGGASATSGGSKKSKGSSDSKKMAEMTEEEKKAFYKARAAKAAATKAAKKAAEAGGSEAPAAEEAPVAEATAAEDEVEMEEESDAVAPQPIELDLNGKGKQTYGYIDHAGTRYIFKTDGSLLGALNPATGKLRKVKPEENPFA